MIERDLLTLIRDTEQAGEEKVENAKKKAEELKSLLENEKSEIVKKLESEFLEKVKAKKAEEEKKLQEAIKSVKEDEEKRVALLKQSAERNLDSIAKEITEKILKEVNS